MLTYTLTFFVSVMIPASINAEILRYDPRRMYSIPDMSPLQPIDINNFTPNHLQPGLDNDSNCCCLLSIIQCLHRLGFINALNIPLVLRRANGSPDYATGILAKILCALPSNGPFSVRTFIQSWNRSNLGIQLGQNEDLFIVEGVIKKLQFRDQGGIPFLTTYKATFYCNTCQTQYRGLTEWDNPSFETIPEIGVPNQQNAVNPADLMTTLMTETFPVRCRVCQGQGTASYEIVKGKTTMIRLNRLDFQNQQMFKIMTPLDVGPSNSPGSQFLGELVAVVCHISRPHQHWLSYVKTDQGWYLQDDSNPPFPSSPLNSNNRTETINLLCYKN